MITMVTLFQVTSREQEEQAHAAEFELIVAMFSDHYIRQRAASYRGSKRDPPTHAESTLSPPGSAAAAGLGCKSKITLSQKQQLFIPPNVKSHLNSRRCSNAAGAQKINPRQPPSSQQRHSVPTVMMSTRLPVVYSPRHSLSTGSRTKKSSSSPSKPNSSSRPSSLKPNSSKQFPFVSHRDSYDVDHSTRMSLSPKKRSADNKRHTSGASSTSTDSVRAQSIHSYLYDSARPGPRRRVSQGASISTSSRSSSCSSKGRREPWRKMSHTFCMGEGLMLEDDDTCSYSGIGSVEDSESYMDSCSRDYTEADLDDDLTDLDNSDNETPFDVSSHQSHDTLTLVQSVSGESDMEPSKGKNQAAPVNYASDELVAEVERRRKKDFGQTESTESLRKQYRITSLLICPTKKTSIGPPLVEVEEPLESKPISTDSLEQLPNNSGPLSETTPTTLTCDDGEMDRHCTPTSSPLTPSMFPDHLPHTIHFPLQDEPYTPLPKESRALLKWKVCSLTPNIVKKCISRVGFTKITKGSAWLGYWGKHMKVESFRHLREYQKFNHFPGTFEIGRKDRLWRNLSRLQARVGKRDLDFVPHTYVLPQDTKLLKKVWNESAKQKWILKPPAAARGIGIRVVSHWGQIPKRRPVVVQRYLSDPYLINGSKFDLRIYVYVSCYDPLKIYVFKEGLARFATCKYSSAMKHLSNRFMHLTNYSINKQNSEFTPNTDETVCQGHKWGLLALWRYMKTELGVDTDSVWQSITELVVKTIICSEPSVVSNVKANVRTPYSVHELFGFDVMLDRRLKPWILEVNISPSLHSQSQLDVNIKGQLVRDLFNITGFTLPTREQLTGEQSSVRYNLTTEERAKHSAFIQRGLQMVDRSKVVDSLTADDLHVIMQAEDELSRCGEFERVFPCSNYNKYKKFFEVERYYNVLLGEWTAKYQRCSKKGMSLLQKQAKLLAKQLKKDLK